MKKIFAILFLITFSTACSTKPQENISASLGEINKNMPIPRGQAVKMLALSKYSIDEINNMERNITIEDTDITNWCDKYINAANKSGIISGTQENTFLQNDSLTLEQADFILKKYSDKNLILQYDKADRKKPIAYDVWLQAFDAIKGSTEQKELIILADKSNCKQLLDNYIITDYGLFNAEGIEIKPEYLNCGIKAYVKDNQLLAITEITNLTPTIKSAVVAETNNDGAYFNICGNKIFFYNTDVNLKEGETMDIKIEGNKLIEGN